MSDPLEGLEPRALWSYFSTVASIPRPSKHEEKIAGWIRSLAAEKGWEVQSDGDDQVADAVLEQQFGEFYVSRLLPGAALQSLEIHNRRDAESPLILEYAFEVDTIGRRNDEAWAIPPLFPHQFLARYANVDRRTTTQILFPRPNIEVNLRVIPPSGGEFVMNQQEDEQVADTTLGLAASNRMRLDDGVLVSTRRIQFSPSLIPAEAYPALVDFCRQADVVDRREINIRLTP